MPGVGTVGGAVCLSLVGTIYHPQHDCLTYGYRAAHVGLPALPCPTHLPYNYLPHPTSIRHYTTGGHYPDCGEWRGIDVYYTHALPACTRITAIVRLYAHFVAFYLWALPSIIIVLSHTLSVFKLLLFYPTDLGVL